jgi:hypothetical protein
MGQWQLDVVVADEIRTVLNLHHSASRLSKLTSGLPTGNDEGDPTLATEEVEADIRLAAFLLQVRGIIFSTTESRLKLAGRWRIGKSFSVASHWPVAVCAGTTRKACLVNHSS